MLTSSKTCNLHQLLRFPIITNCQLESKSKFVAARGYVSLLPITANPWRWRNAVSLQTTGQTYNKMYFINTSECCYESSSILTSIEKNVIFTTLLLMSKLYSSECCDPMGSKLSPNSPACCPLPLPGSGALKHYKVIRSDDTGARGGTRKLLQMHQI